MLVRQANFLVVCAAAAFGLAASLALAFATATLGGSAQASVEASAGVQIDPLQIMMNSKDLPAPHYDDYSVVFN
jgi:hypothetical protein